MLGRSKMVGIEDDIPVGFKVKEVKKINGVATGIGLSS